MEYSIFGYIAGFAIGFVAVFILGRIKVRRC